MRRLTNENSIQPKHKIRHPFSVTRATQLEKSSMPAPDERTFNFVFSGLIMPTTTDNVLLGNS